MRKYVLHGNERVYFEDSPHHYEIPCTQCGTEIPEERVFWMRGTITRTDLPTITLGGGSLGQAPFHEGCVTSYVARKVAEVDAS